MKVKIQAVDPPGLSGSCKGSDLVFATSYGETYAR